MAKAAGRLTYAFANASVPKVTVIAGEAYGTAYLTMNSKAIGADIVYAWPDATIGMMDSTAAVKIMYADEIGKADNGAALIQEKAAQYQELQSSALAAAKRGYVDDIVNPEDTRKRVIAAFEMLFTKREDRPSKKPVSYTHLDVYKRQEYTWYNSKDEQQEISLNDRILAVPGDLPNDAKLVAAVELRASYE